MIEFDGRLSTSGQSGGHYTCDVKAKDLRSWFRTNDDCTPVPLSVSEVSQKGYVILYKRK